MFSLSNQTPLYNYLHDGLSVFSLIQSNTMMFYMDFLFSVVGVLLGVAFFTLMERKMMGLMHYRKGPNKVILWGITQPIADAMKLLTKESPKLSSIKTYMYISGPSLSIVLMLLCWGWYDYTYIMHSSSMKIMLILSVMSLSAYGFLLTSWGSNSKYALLGGYRAVGQIISYEVCLLLFILVLIYICKSYTLENLKSTQQGLWMVAYSIPLFTTWMMLCMAESNRTPFDLAEGESEIVSGFNIEYGGGLFALIFISEYGMIMFLSFLTSLLFLGGSGLLVKTFLICMTFVWVRCSFPRVRYDILMMMAWKMALPYSLGMIWLSTYLAQ